MVPVNLVGEFAINQSHPYALTLVQNSLFFAGKLIHISEQQYSLRVFLFFLRKVRRYWQELPLKEYSVLSQIVRDSNFFRELNHLKFNSNYR
jgi:hypothetical protein